MPLDAAGQAELLFGQDIGDNDPIVPANDPPEPITPATPVEPVTPVAAEPLTPTTPAAPVVSPFMRQVAELGFKDVSDESVARDRLLEAYRVEAQQRADYERQLVEAKQLSQYGQQYLQQQADPAYQQFLAQRQQPTQQPATDDKWWNAPKLEKEMVDRYREIDPANPSQYRWKDGTPAEVRTGAESYQAYVENWTEKLLTNPIEVLPRAVEQIVMPMIEKYFSEQRSQQEVLSFADQVKSQNADWLYAKDPRTQQPLIDPVSRQPFYSPEGQQVMGYVQKAAQIGITDAREQWEYAVAMSSYHGAWVAPAPAAPPAPAPTPAQNVQTKQVAMLKRGARGNPSRGGSVPAPEEKPRSQNPHQRPGNKLLDQLNRDGVVVD